MQYKEVLNSEEAADLLGVKPFTIRTYARRGVIPGKKLGNEWRFVKNDLMAWLRGMETEGGELETLTGAKAFLQRLSEDSDFQQKIESLSTDAERMALVQKEGFVFTLQELEQAIKAELDEDLEDGQESKVIRRAQRYQVYLKVSELNGQPVTDTMILDINAWGARVGSFKPFDAMGNIEITFTPPGENQNVRISGEVVWSRLMPAESRYHAGVEFSEPIDQLHREGKI
ncbi:MAG: Nif11-like leader peptide family RiPP precursor [Desulfobaccales bacterium]